MENDKVKAWITPISNRSVQGNSISASVLFDVTGTNEIDLNMISYKMVIQTNGIPSVLNNSSAIIKPTKNILE